MRKILFLFVLLGAPVHAAQQCISFGDLSSTDMNDYTAGLESVDWSLVWPQITISGIAVCAKTVGEVGDVAVALKYDYSGRGNIYCWCRMLRPAVSYWIASGNMGDLTVCLDECAISCADAVMFGGEVRSAMLDNLGK